MPAAHRKPALRLAKTFTGAAAALLITAAIMLSGCAKPDTTAACASNLRQVGTALQLYVSDYDGMYPPSQGTLISAATKQPFSVPWSELLVPYVRGNFPACPARVVPSDTPSEANKPRNSGYGYNSNLSNAGVMGNQGGAQSVVSNPALVVTAFDSRIEFPALVAPDTSGSSANTPGATRHNGKANYLFADGHIRALAPGELKTGTKSDGAHPGFGL